MEKFQILVLGTTDVPTYAASLIFAFLGLAFYYYFKVKNRDVDSSNTPYTFSLSFFTKDNLTDLVFSIIGILLALRFSVEYAGVDNTMIYAFGLGLAPTKIIDWLTSFKTTARQKHSDLNQPEGE